MTPAWKSPLGGLLLVGALGAARCAETPAEPSYYEVALDAGSLTVVAP